MASQAAGVPPASVYNEDYFADVATSPSLSVKKGPRDKEDKKKTKINDFISLLNIS